MKQYFAGIVTAYLLVASLSLPLAATAADTNPCPPGPNGEVVICNPIGNNTTLPGLLTKIFRETRKLVTYIIPLIVIFGAFQMLTSAGNPEKFAAGRNTIVYSIIGFVIMLAAEGIASMVERILTK